MRKEMFRIILVAISVPILLVSCGPSLPNWNSTVINVLQIKAKEVTLAELQAAYSGSTVMPPLYEQPLGTTLYGIVVTFDVPRLPDGVNFTEIGIFLFPLKSSGGANEDVEVVTMIPMSVDRTSDVAEATNIAAEISGTISKLSGKVGVEQGRNEAYQKIYRSVSAHINPAGAIRWEFTPFLDETIHPGTYYVIGVFAIPNDTTGNKFKASGYCRYEVTSPLGESSACGNGETPSIIIP